MEPTSEQWNEQVAVCNDLLWKLYSGELTPRQYESEMKRIGQLWLLVKRGDLHLVPRRAA
jgi:hypothetical protein